MADDHQEDTKLCSNCKRDIPSINYVMHQTHCARNIKLCEHCQEPVPRSEMEAHFEEEHKKIPCKCGESIEKSKMEEHEEKHCLSRPAKCDYCELELPYAKMGEHKDVCGVRTELCEKCNRYIQLKDLDVHVAMACTYPEVPTQTKTKPLSHFNDHADGYDAFVLAPEWHGMWHHDHMQSLISRGTSHERPSDDLFDLISPTTRGSSWNPNNRGSRGDRTRTGHQGGADRRHVKNQDRVQNSFGVTSKTKKSGAKTAAGSHISRPWEKNEERQQTLSQEQSDRLLAMHLAQDLQGSKLTPGEHLNTFTTQDMVNFPSEIDLDQMLKENYSIPTVNTYQEPKFTTVSPTENTDVNSTMLPCEFCQQCFSPETLIEHQSGCRPDVASYAPAAPTSLSSTNNNRQAPLQGLSVRPHLSPHIHDNLGQNVTSTDWMSSLPVCSEADSPTARKPSVDAEDDDNSVMLPCEFCGDLLPFEFLTHHQVNCTENGSQTPVPPTSMETNPAPRHTAHNTSSPTRLRHRRVPIPTSLELNQRPTKHQAEPSLDVLMASPDSKPTNDETSQRPRHTSQPRTRKTKVTSTVTRPSGHGVNLAINPSPVDKYLNGSPSERDVSNGIIAPKPRVVTVEKKVRPHNKSTSKSQQHLSPKITDIHGFHGDDEASPVKDDNDIGLVVRNKGKSAKSPAYSPSSLPTTELNNRQRQSGKARTKPLKTGGVGRVHLEGQYQPSFGAGGEDKRRGSREKNYTKPSNRSRHHHSAGVVNLEPDDDLGPPLRLKSTNQTTGGAKPKQKKRSSKKPDNDTV